MLRTHWLFLYRLCALAAVLVSGVLFLHYLSPINSGVCASGGGCDTVRSSVERFQLGRHVNIPLFGILAYLGVFFGSLFPVASRLFRSLLWGSVVGGVLALLLVVLQALVIQAFCWLCLIVDGLAVATAFVALKLNPVRSEQRQIIKRWAWVSLAICAVVLPLLWGGLKPAPPVPSEITALYKPGKINVVEFADYECPYCARLHPVLKGVLKQYGERVHFVRKHMPLVQHKFADHAARGVICAEAQGEGEKMSDILFRMELRKNIAFRHAKKLKLDLAAFEECMRAASTRERIEADILMLQKIGFDGLPTTFVGDEKFVGVRPVAVLKEIVARAAQGQRRRSVPTSIFVLFGTVLVLAIALLGRQTEPEKQA